jgi:DNA (cytosine-5)-methyltransferase 1
MLRLLDLFCGAGGAAMGYHRAGFEVVGVDLVPQPNYPFAFVQADALTYPLEGFDAIHASPPCQAHSTVSGRHRARYVDAIAATRARLEAAGVPYVIENVVGAPLRSPTRICGSSLGLDVRRHRLFETNWALWVPPCAHGAQAARFRSLDSTQASLASVVGVHGHINYAGERELRERAMEIDWMTPRELAQAIPPAYTELIGYQLAAELRRRAALLDVRRASAELERLALERFA